MLACPYTFVPKELWTKTTTKSFPVRVVVERNAPVLATADA
jgi:hypothetical protein